MNMSRVVFKPGWLLPLAVISIALVALVFGAATSNTAEAQGGGPGNGGRGGGGHDNGAWEHCSSEPIQGAINAALIKLNAREAGGHHYTLLEVIACGVLSQNPCEDSADIRYAFRFIVEDDLRRQSATLEKNVRVCYH